jgi:hypothetical protein
MAPFLLSKRATVELFSSCDLFLSVSSVISGTLLFLALYDLQMSLLLPFAGLDSIFSRAAGEIPPMNKGIPKRYENEHTSTDHHANTHIQIVCQGERPGIKEDDAHAYYGD